MRGRWTRRIVMALVLAALLIQLVPYGRAHSNPPVRAEPAWADEQTRALAEKACFACHSNQTDWGWYTNIAPVSWLTQHDVDEGRGKLNFSTWDQPSREARDAAEIVREGEMPPLQYRLIHPEARLSDADREALAAGLERMFGRPERSGQR